MGLCMPIPVFGWVAASLSAGLVLFDIKMKISLSSCRARLREAIEV
jgi:hypothetical protein